MTEHAAHLPEALRARLSADYLPVKPLVAPMARALWLLPIAVMTLLAAQFVFELRVDAPRLGWTGTWGVSSAQVVLGLIIVTAALREAVPGRSWSRAATLLWIGLPIAIVVAITWVSWEASPVVLRGGWYFVGGLCLAGSAVSALPAVALASILAARAYPLRPAVAGALLGLGAGLMADAGWRLFCHFSEPAHVLSAHLGGVLISMCLGAVMAKRLATNP
jgi:Negative regulator of sigma F